MRCFIALAAGLGCALLVGCLKNPTWPEPPTQELESGRFTHTTDTVPANKVPGLEGMSTPGENKPADAVTPR